MTNGEPRLRLQWDRDYLTISGERLPGRELKVHYLEAYCRSGSTNADWVQQTLIGHTTQLEKVSNDGTFLELTCTLRDGVQVSHLIRATHDEVDFQLTARNPTGRTSDAQWAQPCVRVDRFTGADQQSYLPKSFVFLDGALERMPTRGWNTEANRAPGQVTLGQVWCPPGVDPGDVNPRPLNPLVASNGLIGCYSGDDSMIFATAFEPYQELFQGVAVCLHSDFRIGGLERNETKRIRGKIYLVPNDIPALLARYKRDFPEHNHTGYGSRETSSSQ